MIETLRAGAAPAVDPRAVVVVGAGAAGLALALALADRGVPVVLLERGGVAADLEGDTRAPTEPGTGLSYRVDAGRAAGLGGTSEFWHGQCMRLHDEDLAVRSWIPQSGWPFGSDVLGPWYEAAERFFELSGSGYGASRWDAYPALPPLEWKPGTVEHDFTEYAPRPYLGRRFQNRLQTDPRIHVLVHAAVDTVVLDGAAVTGVQVHDSDGQSTFLAATRVVLASGTIANAEVLLRSDPAGVGLGTGRAHTGRWLQDHPVARLGEVVADDTGPLQDRFTGVHRGRQKLFPKLRLSPEAQRDEQLLDATAIFVHDYDSAPLTAARQAVSALRAGARRPSPADVVAIARALIPGARALYRRHVRGLSAGGRPDHVWLDVWTEQVPAAENRVALSDHVAPDGTRGVVVHWHVGEAEMRTTRRLADIVDGELRRLGIGHLDGLPTLHDDASWQAGVRDAFHPAGTTRMSADPEGGVVDPELQVHGVDGLFVVGASVFPIAGYANPTLTIVALALRLADNLGSNTATVAA